MQLLIFKVLFRKKGTASAIVAVALLIALVTAVNCLVNNINQQTTLLTKLATTGETYLVTSKNSLGLSDSQIESVLPAEIRNNSNVQSAFSETIAHATLTTENLTCSVVIRGLDDPAAYYKAYHASVNGSFCQNNTQANVGVILAKLVNISKNDLVNLTINGKPAAFFVAGVVQANQQTDAELTIQLSTLQSYLGADSVSCIEFSLKEPAKAESALKNITQTLPLNTKITETQQVASFAQSVNSQTVAFITLWSVAVYIVVAAASYVIAARAVNEAEYELGMIRTIGAKKNVTFQLVLTYALVIGLAGSVLGVSAGIVGTQAASTFVRWIWGNTFLAPFLEPTQALWILLFTFSASIIGSFYPALMHRFSILEATP
jgi:ABC-type lipoprotein release transport system permease subunit